MKFSRKRRNAGAPDVADAPSEVVSPPVDFRTMPEVLASAGLTIAGDEEAPEGPDESPQWEFSIDGMPPLETDSVKWSVFTPGEATAGDMVVEIRVTPGLTSKLFSWLKKPTPLRCSLDVTDHEGKRLEKWSMLGQPTALAVNELAGGMGEPWFITLQLTMRDITVS